MKKRVLLVGGRRKEKALALSLLTQGYRVTAINDTLEDCQKLAEIDKLRVLHGDGTRLSVLEDAEAGSMDIVIALTAQDEDNLVICELCKKHFHVDRTVALVSDPAKIEFFHRVGVDSVVCALSTITSILAHQARMDQFSNVVPIGDGGVEIVEVPVSKNAPCIGKQLWEIQLPEKVILACILRGDKSIVPKGNTAILAGDLVVLIADHGQETEAVRVLTGA
ncbi:MAG: NAD-binding protein [Oscillospiraceae bacterium]|nr:NAD-binding protein [Oscillospiraceae bacterium]